MICIEFKFIFPGWNYIKQGHGSSHLPKGGSVVSAVSFDGIQISIVVEKMSWANSFCIRPNVPEFSVYNETITFQLNGSLSQWTTTLYAWKSYIAPFGSGKQSVLFEQQPPISLVNGQFTVTINVDELWSFSSLSGQKKGQHPAPPAPSDFPVPYADSFDTYAPESEAKYFTDQTGTFAIYYNAQFNTNTMRQVVPTRPIEWCPQSRAPISLIGDSRFANTSVTIDVLIEGVGGAVVAARVARGGCEDSYQHGYFLSLGMSPSITGRSHTTADGCRCRYSALSMPTHQYLISMP
jgi:galactosylceramidase